MFIPLEGENIICLENVVAIYREDGKTAILKTDGTREFFPFTPATLAERYRRLEKKSSVKKDTGEL